MKIERWALLASTAVFVLGGVAAAVEDPLPRRGFLGAMLALPEEPGKPRGVPVQDVFADSAASEAGLLPNDRLVRVASVELSGRGAVADVVAAIGSHRAGDGLAFEVERAGETRQFEVTLKPIPKETHPNFDTVYDSAEVDGALHRVILTKPRREGPFPVVFYVQGLGCSSIDKPHNPDDVVRQFLSGLTEAGYATFRIDKSGEGDSQGPPCESIGFQQELKGYRAGVEHLMHHEDINAQEVFLFGHSMGGVFAPLLAAEYPVAGVIAYGTIAAPLEEYFPVNNRRQMEILERTPEYIEREIGKVKTFIEALLGDRLTPHDAEAAHPELRGFLSVRNSDGEHFHGRHYSFWHELDDVNLPEPWNRVDCPVLALWGEADVAATRDDHERLVRLVNARHPESALFETVPRTSHGFSERDDMRAALANRTGGPFNPAVVEQTLAWLNRTTSRN